MYYYINSTPTENGNYGNPHSNKTNDSYALPDALLQSYLDSMGFVFPTVSDGVVTALERNVEAYEAYQAAHPDTPEPEPEPTEFERLEAQALYTAVMTDTLLEG